MKNKMVATSLMALALMSSSALVTSCASTPREESTGQYIDSSSITTKVKAKLLADEQVHGLPIKVNTYKNVVQLSGFVNTVHQKRRASQLTLSVPGVERVQNALIVK